MNYQKDTADQVVKLQNIAYVKQFMQKTSIKLLAVVAFFQAILTGYTFFKFTDIFEAIITFASNMSPEFASSSSDMLIEFELMMNALSVVFTVIGILAVGFALILPVTLLVIIIRASNENPSVVPSGAVNFLKVLSAIQLVLMIISGALSLLGSIITLISGNTSAVGVNSQASNVFSVILSIITILLSCFYYYLQFRFLSSVHTSAKGNVLLYTGAKGYGVYSVIFAIFSGLYAVGFSIFLIIMGSLSNSDTLMSDDAVGTLFMESIDIIMPFFVLMFASVLLSFLYQVLMAVVAFGYKNTVVDAIRASYATAQGVNPYNRASGTGNSPFRTYGGNGSYSNYNYNIANNLSQASGQTSVKGRTSSQNVTTIPQNTNNTSQEGYNAPQESYNPPQNSYSEQAVSNQVNLNKEPVASTSYNDNPYNNYGDDINV